MNHKIIKRDGTEEEFSSQKIMDAILKAFLATDGDISEYAEVKAYNIALYIERLAEDKKLTVDQIQDLVEKGLMSTKRKDVAKNYVIYRNNRDIARGRATAEKIKIMEKLTASNIQNQNANVDEASFGGRKGEAAAIQMKNIALYDMMSDLARTRHLNNEIYTHDLDSYAVGQHNCLTVPFDDLLANGFNTRQTDVRPANSINTAFQLVAVIFQLQSLQQFGGVSASHLDWTMVPYVRKSFYKHYKDGLKYINESLNPLYKEFTEKMNDTTPINEYTDVAPKAYQYAMDMTIKECQQAVEGMYHNLNTLQSRSGN